MKVSNHTLLLACFWLLAVLLTDRLAHVAAAMSRPDQYHARHDIPPSLPPRPAASSARREATDHPRSHGNVLELNANPDRNHDNDRVKLSLIVDSDRKHRPYNKKQDHDGGDFDDLETGMNTNELGEMQVGCGQGLFEVVPAPKPADGKTFRADKKLIRKRSIQRMKDRRKRNYHSTFTVWQAPVYQVPRPYVIPVWGAQGQMPMYFPPQQIHPDALGDPRKSYLPPKGYLPPTRTTTIGYDDDDYEDEGGNIALNNRNNFDDAPVWDFEPIQTRPPSSRPQARPPIRTTPAPGFTQPRRTRRPGFKTTTPPSLVHRSENNTNTNLGAQRPNSLRPLQDRPNIVEVPSFRPSQGGFGGVPPSTPRPRPSQFPSTSQTPSPPAAQPSRAQPSRCVWAIISCCQGNNQKISYSCFEQLGCTGAFWDKSPCDSDFAKAAVDIALQYYSQK